MNVFMITSVPVVPPWDQGDKNLAYALTAALPEHRFRVLTTRNGPTPTDANLDPEPIYQTRRPSLGQKARVYWRLLRSSGSRFENPKSEIRNPKSEIDMYHLVYRPYALSSWLCRLLPEFRQRPTLHTVPATADGRPLGRHLFFADRVVALSQHGRQTLQRLGLDNVAHIPPGIEVARWAALRSRTDHLKTQLELAGHPVVLFPGHYSPGYGADVMLRAVPHIAAQVPGVRVIFACRLRSPGDSERERATRRAVAEMGLSQAVRFYNTVPDMRSLIGASDLTVLPLETMRDKVDIPTTLLESLAAGKPIVISDLPPMNEVMQGSRGAGVQGCRGDKETRRQGKGERRRSHLVTPSPCHPLSPAPRHLCCLRRGAGCTAWRRRGPGRGRGRPAARCGRAGAHGPAGPGTGARMLRYPPCCPTVRGNLSGSGKFVVTTYEF